MYYYIYDISLSHKKYEKTLQKMEAKLVELGIAGKIKKLNVLKNLKEVINEAENAGVKNIIAVGNDQTVSKVANLAIDKEMVVGMIPIDEPNMMSSAFGINDWEEACQIIGRRKIEEIDVGRVNKQYFLFSVESQTENITFDFENYSIRPLKNNALIGLFNINITGEDFRSNPRDGAMEAVFLPGKDSWWSKLVKRQDERMNKKSIFPIKSLTISHTKKAVNMSIDRHMVLKTPLEIEVLRRKLKVIVGKGRIFN